MISNTNHDSLCEDFFLREARTRSWRVYEGFNASGGLRLSVFYTHTSFHAFAENLFTGCFGIRVLNGLLDV